MKFCEYSNEAVRVELISDSMYIVNFGVKNCRTCSKCDQAMGNEQTMHVPEYTCHAKPDTCFHQRLFSLNTALLDGIIIVKVRQNSILAGNTFVARLVLN